MRLASEDLRDGRLGEAVQIGYGLLSISSFAQNVLQRNLEVR